MFFKHLVLLDPKKSLVDLLFFDGASNMQIGGEVIGAIYPRITCLHGVEHSIALVFSDWAKIQIIKVSTILYVIIYRPYNNNKYNNTKFICILIALCLLQLLIFKI